MVPTTTNKTITSACLSHAHKLWTRCSPTQGVGLSNEACQQPCMTVAAIVLDTRFHSCWLHATHFDSVACSVGDLLPDSSNATVFFEFSCRSRLAELLA